MADLPDISHPPDICLLLRAHSEQHWLISQVVPVLRQIEQRGAIPDDQLGAAFAYLETLWLDARRRSAETDSARARLDALVDECDRVLYDKAHRYHAAVRRLRSAVGHRVGLLTRSPCHDEPLTLADL